MIETAFSLNDCFLITYKLSKYNGIVIAYKSDKCPWQMRALFRGIITYQSSRIKILKHNKSVNDF